MSESKFSGSEFRKHPAAQRFFYFCFQDDLLSGRVLAPGEFAIVVSPPGELNVTGQAITTSDVADPITGEVAQAGKTLAGFFTGGVNGGEYKITATAKDDGSPTQEVLVKEVMLIVRNEVDG